MNEDSPFSIQGDEAVEARIVSWVLGEASAFEAAELERLCEERPELLIYRRRMIALHGLLSEAEAAGPNEAWKLPPGKRKTLEKLFGEEKAETQDADKEKRIRRSGRRAFFAIAACLVLTVVVAGLLATGDMDMQKASKLFSERRPELRADHSIQSFGMSSVPRGLSEEIVVGEQVRPRGGVGLRESRARGLVRAPAANETESKSSNRLESLRAAKLKSDHSSKDELGKAKTEVRDRGRVAQNNFFGNDSSVAPSAPAQTTRPAAQFSARLADESPADMEFQIRQRPTVAGKPVEPTTSMARVIPAMVSPSNSDSVPAPQEVAELSDFSDVDSFAEGWSVQEKTQDGFEKPAIAVKRIAGKPTPPVSGPHKAKGMDSFGLATDSDPFAATSGQMDGLEDRLSTAEGISNMTGGAGASLEQVESVRKYREASKFESPELSDLDSDLPELAYNSSSSARPASPNSAMVQGQMDMWGGGSGGRGKKGQVEALGLRGSNSAFGRNDTDAILVDPNRDQEPALFRYSLSSGVSGSDALDSKLEQIKGLDVAALHDAQSGSVDDVLDLQRGGRDLDHFGSKKGREEQLGRKPKLELGQRYDGDVSLSNFSIVEDGETATPGNNVSGVDKMPVLKDVPSAGVLFRREAEVEDDYAAEYFDTSGDSFATELHEHDADGARRGIHREKGNDHLGGFDEAHREYQDVLRRVANNTEALRELESIELVKDRDSAAAENEARIKLLAEVEAAWEVEDSEEAHEGLSKKLGDLAATDARHSGAETNEDLFLSNDLRLLKLRVAEPIINPVDFMEEIAASEDPYSTFSLNISDASFKVAQAALAKGEQPDPAGIKVEQFYNAVDYGDPAPSAGEPVSVSIEQVASPVIPGRNLVRVALKTAATGRSAAQSLRLTLLVDQSGSMVREDRRAAMNKALAGLGSLLTKDDQITVIGFSRTSHLLADGLAGDKAGNLADLVNQAASEGGTNLEEAINLAEQKAVSRKFAGAQNRIVLFTDGAANLGDADPERLAEKVKALRQKGISFDIAGIAADGLNDELLGELARNGNGRYYVVGKGGDDNFAKQLAGAFRPAAENVKVQVHFNPERVGKYKLIGFEKDRLKTEDFRNDAVDAAELAAEEAGVAIYQVEPLPGGTGELGEVSVRFRDTASDQMVERTWTIQHDANAPVIDRATASMQLGVLSMLAGEKLKGGPLADVIDFKQFTEAQANVKHYYGNTDRVVEMLNMVDALK